MIDLVDTHKKCETSGKYKKIQFPYGCPDRFVKEAMVEAPSDPHVLERCGRHYRQRASSKKDFTETVDIFDKLLDLHPNRHVALHQKGLACRALWLIVGGYDEARLYNNSARKGKKKRVKKQQTYSKGSYTGASAATAEFGQNFNLISLRTDQQVYQSSPTVQFQSSLNSIDEGYQSILVDKGTADAQEDPSNPPTEAALRTAPLPRQLPTLPPYKSDDIGVCPSQLKKPDFFDVLRTNNPPAKNGGSRQYLKQAKECFEKAKAITNGTCSLYLVDLARTLISLGEYDTAEKEFQAAAACHLASTMNPNDATYLYEQWALLRHSRVNAGEVKIPEKEARQQMTENVAPLYRQAILSAVRARGRARIAFYNQLDLLSEELRREVSA